MRMCFFRIVKLIDTEDCFSYTSDHQRMSSTSLSKSKWFFIEKDFTHTSGRYHLFHGQRRGLRVRRTGEINGPGPCPPVTHCNPSSMEPSRGFDGIRDEHLRRRGR